ncbi:MAG: cob(I)yrinic acid a,c-diamide adenosyltransferase [Phycisphaerae bacterium]
MKLYTKTGDDGTTGLVGGSRIRKSELVVRAYGEVDELNAAIGIAIARCADADVVAGLQRVQDDLFSLGCQLATPAGTDAKMDIHGAHIAVLEGWIDTASAGLPPLRQFVLPGGCDSAAALHMARAVCRRAERTVVALAEHEPVSAPALAYLNRLSDLLFVLARLANHRAGVGDTPWRRSGRDDDHATT